MISVIIASADPALLALVKKSIDETIGVPYEVLAFANGDGAKSIASIYNEGIRLAKYPVLCLMHEDVSFVTQNWGEAVMQTFDQNPRLGIIGVAGTTFKSVMPIGWPSEGSPEAERSNLLQSYKYTPKETARIYKNPENETVSPVVAVDGVWMCVRKEVAAKYRFDDKTFKGFHCYDVDFCLSAGKDFTVAVIYNVLLNHLSEGNWDRTWLEQSLLLYKKWESFLPQFTVPFSKKRVRKIERQNFRFWLQRIRAQGFDKKLAFQILHRPKLFKVLGLKYFLKLHYSIFKEYHFDRQQT